MADLTLTVASVQRSTGAVTLTGTAGETITAGQLVYLSSSDNLYYKADANASGKDQIAGIALHASLVGQPLTIQTDGLITIGATTAVGTIYVLSANPGFICPAADLASGWKTSELGVGSSVTQIDIAIFNSGYAVP